VVIAPVSAPFQPLPRYAPGMLAVHVPARLPADVVVRPGPVFQAARAAPPALRNPVAGSWVALTTTPAAAARIAAGLHQIRTVDGVSLAYPSQNLPDIESAEPLAHGQTHGLTEHVGNGLADNVRRLDSEPLIRAAGGYTDEARAQIATDRTIANPANQRAIAVFLSDPERLKTALERVDLGRSVGTTTTRDDLNAGHPRLIPGRTATVVLIKDATFPEGYRVLTTYPDTRPFEVDARGNRQA
jgi:hypothetical protein